MIRMKTKSLLLTLLILINACASHSSFIDNEENSYAQLNSKLKDRKGRILLTDGRAFVGQNVVVTENFSTWLDAKLKTSKSIPTSRIDMISIKTQKGHGGIGLILGALAGGAAGYIILTKTGEDNCQHTSKVHLCAGNELAGLISVVLGGGIGYTVGNSLGSTKNYIFNATEH